MANFARDLFPIAEKIKQGNCFPILIKPIVDSSEQLTIGMIVQCEDDVLLESANMLDKLHCFYGNQANVLIAVIKASLTEIEAQIDLFGHKVLQNFSPPFSAVSLGEPQVANGKSVKDIAVSRMSAVCSMYNSYGLERNPS